MPKGHTQLQTIGNNTQVDPFGSNVAAALAYKKMERLMTATHMVTNNVPKSESSRERIRDIANSLLTDTIKLRGGFTSLGTDALENIIAQVRLLLSLLDALYTSGLVSEMNLRILKNAYIDFTQSLEAMSATRAAEGVELTAEYFSQAPQLSTTSTTLAPRVGHIDAAQPIAEGKSRVQKQSAKERRSSARVSAIIDFITKRGSVGTGDLAQVITDCSSKTLQRDLTMLVASGKLVKSGHKRWTKYALVA